MGRQGSAGRRTCRPAHSWFSHPDRRGRGRARSCLLTAGLVRDPIPLGGDLASASSALMLPASASWIYCPAPRSTGRPAGMRRSYCVFGWLIESSCTSRYGAGSLYFNRRLLPRLRISEVLLRYGFRAVPGVVTAVQRILSGIDEVQEVERRVRRVAVRGDGAVPAAPSDVGGLLRIVVFIPGSRSRCSRPRSSPAVRSSRAFP